MLDIKGISPDMMLALAVGNKKSPEQMDMLDAAVATFIPVAGEKMTVDGRPAPLQFDEILMDSMVSEPVVVIPVASQSPSYVILPKETPVAATTSLPMFVDTHRAKAVAVASDQQNTTPLKLVLQQVHGEALPENKIPAAIPGRMKVIIPDKNITAADIVENKIQTVKMNANPVVVTQRQPLIQSFLAQQNKPMIKLKTETKNPEPSISELPKVNSFQTVMPEIAPLMAAERTLAADPGIKVEVLQQTLKAPEKLADFVEKIAQYAKNSAPKEVIVKVKHLDLGDFQLKVTAARAESPVLVEFLSQDKGVRDFLVKNESDIKAQVKTSGIEIQDISIKEEVSRETFRPQLKEILQVSRKMDPTSVTSQHLMNKDVSAKTFVPDKGSIINRSYGENLEFTKGGNTQDFGQERRKELWEMAEKKRNSYA